MRSRLGTCHAQTRPLKEGTRLSGQPGHTECRSRLAPIRCLQCPFVTRSVEYVHRCPKNSTSLRSSFRRIIQTRGHSCAEPTVKVAVWVDANSVSDRFFSRRRSSARITSGRDGSCLTKLTWVATASTRRLCVAGACSSSARRQTRKRTRWGCRVSEYDDLIEQAAAQLAGCIISPTPEREAALGRFIGEALRLRSGRLDDWVSRDEAIDLWWLTLKRFDDRARARRRDGNDAAGAHRAND
jgi:hypothetical protein